MNDQAQLAAVLLAGFFSTGDQLPPEAGLAGAGALVSRARPEIVEISDGTCAMVTAQRPRADVAFKPGVTVSGNRTVSADVDQTYTYNLRPIYEFNVRINPLPNSTFATESQLNVAKVTYEPQTGTVKVDGQEVVWMHENALRAACKSHINITH